MADRPTEPTPTAAAACCSRCGRTLGVVSPGRYWLRHAGRTVLIEGLTEAQRITVWCDRCGKEQALAAA